MNCRYCKCKLVKDRKARQVKYCSSNCKSKQSKLDKQIQIQNNENVRWKTIRQYLIEERNECFHCGISEWNNKPISLECDHIDGDRSNNTLKNARLLCPNCHSQTSTFRAKNKDNPLGKNERQKRYKKVATTEGFEPPPKGLEGPDTDPLCYVAN